MNRILCTAIPATAGSFVKMPVIGSDRTKPVISIVIATAAAHSRQMR